MSKRTAAAFAAILFLILFVALAQLATRLLGPTPIAVVQGQSMLPLLREGDIVLAYRPPPNEIGVGDIIIYQAHGKLIIHRVVGVVSIGGRYFFITQGDNNPLPDYLYFDVVDGAPVGVSYDRVMGKVVELDRAVFKIPYLGYLSIWIHGR